MTPGLILFIACVAGDALALLFDLFLAATGRRTITAACRLYPVLAVPLVLWQLAMAAGLAMHLFALE